MTGEPGTAQPRALWRPIVATCAVLVVVNVAGKVGPDHTMLVLGPAMAVTLIVLARRAGLSYEELGLGRRHLRRGLVFAAVEVALVAIVYLVGVALPATRQAFMDERYQLSPASAMVTAFVVIPLATVVPEEIAFRGVLLGLFSRRTRALLAATASSVLFGLWHVLPSLRLSRVNPAITAVVGGGWVGAAVAVLGAVLFTGLSGMVFCELRRRSGSLLAPIGLHWAVNGLGVLTSAVVAARS
jgi:membrane protease YdiL (CAAX protease family)